MYNIDSKDILQNNLKDTLIDAKQKHNDRVG